MLLSNLSLKFDKVICCRKFCIVKIWAKIYICFWAIDLSGMDKFQNLNDKFSFYLILSLVSNKNVHDIYFVLLDGAVQC